MFEPGDHPRFGLEAPAECPVVQEFGGQDLERDGPIQPGIVCFVHGAHSAPAEQAADDELPERRACGQHVEGVAVGSGAGRWFGQRDGERGTRRTAHPQTIRRCARRRTSRMQEGSWRSIVSPDSPRMILRTGPGTRPSSTVVSHRRTRAAGSGC